MDIAKLQTLVDSDASNSTKTRQQVADWCNARVMVAPVPAQDVAQYLVAAGLMAEIVLVSREIVAADGLNKPKVKAALDMVTAIESLPSFDLSVSAYLDRITAALDELITHGFIQEVHKSQILALGDNKRTRAEAAGLEEVTLLHLADANRGVI